MSTADQVLDAIDSALQDWSAGPDAMRSAPERDRGPGMDWATVSAAGPGPGTDVIDLFLMGAAGLSPWVGLSPWPDAGLLTGFLQDEPRAFDVPTWYPWCFGSDHSDVATWLSLDTWAPEPGHTTDGYVFLRDAPRDPSPGTLAAQVNERMGRLLDAALPSRRALDLDPAPVRKLTLPHQVEVSVTMPLDDYHSRLAAEFTRDNQSTVPRRRRERRITSPAP